MLKILIVEDELLNAMAMEEIMSPWGFEFFEPAVTGEEALQRMETGEPDLILMDVRLPGRLDGIETAEEIRKKSGAPVIFFSGFSEERLRELIKIGNFDVITKPVDFENLKEKIGKILAKTETG